MKLKNPKFWYGLAIPFLIMNGFFVANLRVRPELKPFADRPEMAIVSSVFVLIFAVPAFVALVKWLGYRGFLALAALSVFAVGIETFAVVTGWPYGRFVYGEKIGAKIFGLVPWTVPFAWTPVLLGSYALARRLVRERVAGNRFERKFGRGQWNTIFATAIVAVLFDFVLDPGAVSQGFWIYPAGGIFYAVPLSNFAGWLFSGALGAILVSYFAQWHQRELPPKELAGSAFLIALFWTSVCAWSGLWIPAAIGSALCLWVCRVLWSK